MQPEKRFLAQPKSFWACVRTISQKVGYTQRGTRQIKVPTLNDMVAAFRDLGLNVHGLRHKDDTPTDLAVKLTDYFKYRAKVLNEHVEPRLMDAARAKHEFDRLRAELKPKRAFAMNKQKGEKKSEAYLTSIVNMLIEAHSEGLPCDYDPRELTTITHDGMPVRTLARRVDGAFPSAVNPVAVWEIKEYYYTTTFGSRVADGVYESLLDGMELEELREHEAIDVRHYLMVDAHYTWWDRGRSYLCRMVDMLHMGYVDEVLFGYEVIEEMPRIVKEMVELTRALNAHGGELPTD
ncbi:DUF7687 domain-containing protein [Frigidibacter mobilis]|uniref:Uncharacterized protein n=1 Tax=Frigidibacter mobilis TaxID=1335048 RepID=A0A161GK34_9RHOB|nr:hypothetical protein [Frigidibacter mobilis]AMY70253.1 hypothetical protein AKL17_3019 [Frigidibacter mobilis]